MLPRYQRKKDGVERESVAELVAFLQRNSEWTASSAMCGRLDCDTLQIHVDKPRGSSKYIDYAQTRDNAFTFPIVEGISLFFSKRLVILCLDSDNKPYIPSGHFLVNLALERGIPFRTICAYSLLSRFASTKRKFAKTQTSECDVEPPKENTFAFEANRLKAIGPKVKSDFKITDVFPVTNYIKIPLTNGKTVQTSVSFEGLEAKQDYDSNINRVYSRQSIISVKDPPLLNKYILQFNQN